VSVDPRARRVAVVADSLLERLLPELRDAGYGIIQLPPAGLPNDVAQEWLEQIAEHVTEFARTGYEVVLASDGVHDERLREELKTFEIEDLAPAPAEGL
jgi:hypothetical protein